MANRIKTVSIVEVMLNKQSSKCNRNSTCSNNTRYCVYCTDLYFFKIKTGIKISIGKVFFM